MTWYSMYIFDQISILWMYLSVSFFGQMINFVIRIFLKKKTNMTVFWGCLFCIMGEETRLCNESMKHFVIISVYTCLNRNSKYCLPLFGTDDKCCILKIFISHSSKFEKKSWVKRKLRFIIWFLYPQYQWRKLFNIDYFEYIIKKETNWIK